MADPTKYIPGFDYSDWESSNPTDPKPGAQLDNDFANIKTSIDEGVEAIKDVRRSDGKLKNAIVTLDSLASDVKAVLGENDYLQVINDNITEITTVAGIDTEISGVYGIRVDVQGVYAIRTDVTAVAAIDSDVTIVAGVSGDVTTVAGVAANVTTVAGISGDVTTAAGINTEIQTVAGLNTEIAALGPISADISTVAGIDTAVSTVAASDTDVQTVATNITDIQDAAAAIVDLAAKLNIDGSNASASEAASLRDNVGVETLLQGHIDGLILSNAADTDHDITVSVGVASLRDGSGNRKMFSLDTAITKRIDADWSFGTDAGGFPSGLTLAANTHYNVFLIGADNGTVDAGFDTSDTASNLLSPLASYSWFRRIGSVLTGASANILNFTQIGNEFIFTGRILDADVTNPGTSGVLVTMTVPPNQRALISVMALDTSSATNSNWLITSPYEVDQVPSADENTLVTVASAGANIRSSGETIVMVNGSSQLRYRVDSSTAEHTLRIRTFGWIDDRGRNA